jgi:hypothetical protein
MICSPIYIDDSPPTNRATLQPLFSLRRLTKLRIFGFHHLFRFGEDEIEEMAMAWPQLQVLDFSSDTMMPPPQTTLTGLALLFRYCEQLKELTIRIDARTVDPWQDNGKTCKQQVVGLYLGDSPIENADEVSIFLSQYLPRIRNIPHPCAENRPQSDMAKQYRDRWRVVLESLLDPGDHPPLED